MVNIQHRLNHFIKVYDDVISEDACSDIITYFNESKDKELSGVESGEVIDKIRHADELNVSVQHNPKAKKIHSFLVKACKRILEWYKEDVGEYSEWVCDFKRVESFRIKHYDKGEGYYNTHIDNVGGREFAIIFYLNDVEKGGETEFPLLHTKIPPKAGRVLIFPTTYMYPHKANIPTSGDKLIIQGYILNENKLNS